MSSDLVSKTEAILFSEGGSLTLRKLAQLFETNETELRQAIGELSTRLLGSGLTVVLSDTEVSLAVAPETSSAVRAAYARELESAIGDSGLEVLAIILYHGPSTRSKIDYIRGVNTSSTIRTLLSRGLLERAPNPDDGREYIYRATVELLSHLGIRSSQELPGRESIAAEIAAFESEGRLIQQDDLLGTGESTENTEENS